MSGPFTSEPAPEQTGAPRSGAVVAAWQPIASAPKNPAGEMSGPWVLLYCADGVIRQARWTVIRSMLLSLGWADPTGESLHAKKPTHWQPLPAPPESTPC